MVAISLALPAAADAASVALKDGVITYSGDLAESNNLTVSRAGTTLRFEEIAPTTTPPTPPVAIIPTSPCTAGTTPSSAICPVDTVTLLDIGLTARDDVLVISGSVVAGSSFRVVAHGGEGVEETTGGDDGEELIGDAGDDILVGGGGNDTLDGGSEAESAGVDRLDGGPGDDTLSGGPGASQARRSSVGPATTRPTTAGATPL